MGQPTQFIQLETIVAPTTYSQLNSISILNQSADRIDIVNLTSGGVISLTQGQSVTITSSTGFVLPTLSLNSGGTINACIITT